LLSDKEELSVELKKHYVRYMLMTSLAVGAGTAQALSDEEQLGKSIFFDTNLSINNNQSCAACHGPEAGWTGPDFAINAGGSVYEGSIADRFGNRKPPSSAYATPSPVLHFVIEKKEALFIGGNFWDGRATGETLGSPAAEQAQGPFLNPLEQALPDAAEVITRICVSSYAGSFTQVCGADACDTANVSAAYDCVGLSVAAYEGSPEVNQYTSKYDAFLAGVVELTKQEKKGLNLFKSKGKCANCHILDPGPNGQPPLLTDFTFDNLGVPRNPDNPWYQMPPEFNLDGMDWIDKGLGGFLATRLDYQQFAPENYGKQKVPTLRNVDKRPSPVFVKAYAHNGYFKTLKQIVHFYSTRDVKPTCPDPFTTVEDALAQDCWPAPEVPVNVNTKELGKLNLTDAQEDAIVAFMRTLSDGYLP
jgi:cytochrome c peroxidase